MSARSDYRDRDIKDIYVGILSDYSLANDVLGSVGSGIIVHWQLIPAFEYWLPLLVRNKWRQHSFHFRWDSPITLGTILSQFLIKFSSLCTSIKLNKENQFGKNPMSELWIPFSCCGHGDSRWEMHWPIGHHISRMDLTNECDILERWTNGSTLLTILIAR